MPLSKASTSGLFPTENGGTNLHGLQIHDDELVVGFAGNERQLVLHIQRDSVRIIEPGERCACGDS